MKRLLCALLALFTFSLLAPQAHAQVYGIWLKDAKAEKKYSKYLTKMNGEQVLVCEPRTGIVMDRAAGTIRYSPERNEVFVARSDDPTFVPYVIKDGEKVPNGRKSTLGVQGKYIASIRILMPRQSLMGLTREYRMRRAVLDELITRRDEHKKGGQEWMALHVYVLSGYEKLTSWMRGTTYTAAAVKLEKELRKQRKLSKGEAIEARLERALASIQVLDPPERLVAASKEITGGSVSFGLCESEHVRIVYDRSGVTDETIKELIHFAETAIDGFRRDFVDPYLSEDYPDVIPDRLVVEFWFGPSDIGQHERFYTDYYDLKWGSNKEQRLAVRGATKRRDTAPEYLDYGKREDHDLMAVVAHRMGHVLAALHYNANDGEMKQDWLEEAVGYHIAFEYFGRNEETCYAFKGEQDHYAGRKGEEGDQGDVQILLGERFMYNQLALEKGRRIDALAPMTIYAMGDADLAKGWSFYDYLARVEGVRAQQFLRTACRFAREDRSTFIPNWRESAAQLWEASPGDVFRVIDDAWRAYAEAEQKQGV